MITRIVYYALKIMRDIMTSSAQRKYSEFSPESRAWPNDIATSSAKTYTMKGIILTTRRRDTCLYLIY